MKKGLILFFLFPILVFSQSETHKPKLVIGIVVDQMRYDYIARFWDKYSEGGFKKLVKEGASCTHVNFNYMPTYTGPGHASIFTGTTPSDHGVIANLWYNKQRKKYQYCVGDTTFKTVGSATKNGEMSPKQLLTRTITDQLKLASPKSKVIGISLKDRGAILPGGKHADAAYWFDGGDVGRWISSSYYGEELPEWLQQLNAKQPAEKHLSQDWNTLYPIENYTESLSDDNPYEGTFKGEELPVFPHQLSRLRKKNKNYSLIKTTPFGNSILKELAFAVLRNEHLGQREVTDFLTISFSATDYVGHMYGPLSVEVEDTYLRLDQELAELLSYLDSNYKKEEVLLFLTADHGAVHVPQYLMDNKLPGGYFDLTAMKTSLTKLLLKTYGTDSLVLSISNAQLFLNHTLIAQKSITLSHLEKTITNHLLSKKGIEKVIAATALKKEIFSDTILSNVQKGFCAQRSGDVCYVLNPGWIHSGYPTGTTHGSPYNYDTHVPLLWYGGGIEKGVIDRSIIISDIAPTVAAFLNIKPPVSSKGTPITEIIR